ncbi:MAG: NAD(P)-dependent alcohol dehydrogenase [Salinivirgaceae bacterium]|jgi:NADPH:quinone reductase-like Zn-dependent oxidoreductase|nr:NAD(P)-dependent alcohol dehydrogenase [Salinivirgaceae bacterium]
MKAIECTAYGPPEVLKLIEVDKPIPKNNEVLIKIHATAVTASDIYLRSSELPLRYKIPMRLAIGIKKPRKSIIGLVLAGEIEDLGKDVKRFKKGDQIYGITGFNLGAYAEYTCMKETDSMAGCLALKPSNISYEEATVAAYGGLLALQYLEKGNIQPGQKVLIYGASGTSGTIAIQLAKYYFGAEVTGVSSTRNLDLVKSLGADKVIDYTIENNVPNEDQYDLILDAVGKMKTSEFKKNCKKALSPKGKYISIDDGDLKLYSSRLEKLKEFIEAGHFKTIIDRTYPIEEIVEAHKYVEKGHKTGGVVITF